jgi:hypothetical protein
VKIGKSDRRDFDFMNLAEILIPEHASEMILRGTLTYLGLLILLRVILNRQSGNLNSSDLLVTVLIADAISNGMSGDYKSVPDGLILVSTIIAWDYGIDWLSYRSKLVGRLFAFSSTMSCDEWPDAPKKYEEGMDYRVRAYGKNPSVRCSRATLR